MLKAIFLLHFLVSKINGFYLSQITAEITEVGKCFGFVLWPSVYNFLWFLASRRFDCLYLIVGCRNVRKSYAYGWFYVAVDWFCNIKIWVWLILLGCLHNLFHIYIYRYLFSIFCWSLMNYLVCGIRCCSVITCLLFLTVP